MRAKWAKEISVKDHLESVRKPSYYVGLCRNHEKCHKENVDLGNGYCVACWDKGLGSESEDYDWIPAMG